MSGSIGADGTLTLIRGDSFYRAFRYRTMVDDVKVPVDLTGVTIKAQIRKTADSGYAPLTFTVDYIDRVNGEFALSATAEETASLRTTEGVWDLEFEYSDGTVETKILPSPVVIIKDVTR